MTYIPQRGDFVWIDMDPQAGHEQAGRRPGFVVSPRNYNQASGLALICPITNQAKGFVTEVRVPDGYSVAGVVLSDHIKNLDWQARRARFISHGPMDLIVDVLERLAPLLYKVKPL